MHRNGRKPLGLSFGQGPQFRVYDKVRELQRDTVKLATWLAEEWGEDVPNIDLGPDICVGPDICTRVEFELNREFLVERGIDSIADWVKNRPAIMAYLTGEWFRFKEERVDRENCNYGRAVDSAAWAYVREAFASTWGRAEPAKRRFKRSQIDVTAAAKQVRGLLATVAAQKGFDIKDTGQMAVLAAALLENLSLEECDSPEEDSRATQRLVVDKRRDFEKRYCVPVETSEEIQQGGINRA